MNVKKELQKERELRKELVETLGQMYFAEFGGNARSLEEAMERAPKDSEYEQKIISIIKKSLK